MIHYCQSCIKLEELSENELILNISLQLQRKNLLTLFLILVFIWSLFSVTWSDELVHSGGLSTIGQVLEGLFHPNLSQDILSLAFESTWITFFYAVAGMSLAIVLAFVLGILASGILFNHCGNEDLYKRDLSCGTRVFKGYS